MKPQKQQGAAVLGLEEATREAIGYLNFSSGARNPRFFQALNRLYAEAAGLPPNAIETQAVLVIPAETPTAFRTLLEESARQLEVAGVFRGTEQARKVIALTFDVVLPAYEEFHKDLLLFNDPLSIYQPFYLGRVMEAVLHVHETCEDQNRIAQEAVRLLNDYVGYRPVPVLETRRYEPYPHEKVCPVPLYIRGVGVAFCSYGPLIHWAVRILSEIPERIALQADFDFEQLEELAFDPRSLDFQHPVQHRPNYIYGSWDLHRLNQSGRFSRYVAQKAILDFLCRWIADQVAAGRADHQTIVFQAAGVLATTVLMAMGITGGSPSAIPSTENLGRLVNRIAFYREEVYRWLQQQAQSWLGLGKVSLPTGGSGLFTEVRRSLNRSINDYRAREAHRSRFVQLMAELGQQDIVNRQINLIAGASGRMTTQILAAIHHCYALIREGKIEAAADQLPEVFRLVLRGIDCGALVDPWNILGFGGMFPLAPSPEDSIPDERIAHLLGLVERLFDLHAHILKAAAAQGKAELVERVNDSLAELADWWDQFATTKVSEVVSFSGKSLHHSAQAVARAIAAWHQAGAASGDVQFWREHAAEFPSPKAFASAGETLLQQGDLISTLALMIHWISLEHEGSIREGSNHFPALAAKWMYMLWQGGERLPKRPSQAAERFPQPKTPKEKWQWTRRFFNYLEANGAHWWQAPRFRLADELQPHPGVEKPEEPPNQQEGESSCAEFFPETFAAAYEGVIFRESALDGIDSELLEGRSEGVHSALVEELKRLSDHLFFLASLGALWQYTALQIITHPELDVAETVEHWLTSADSLARGLEALTQQILRYPIQPDSSSLEDLSGCGQRLHMKETLLTQVIEAWVEVEEARWMLAMALPPEKWTNLASQQPHFANLCNLFVAVLRQGPRAVTQAWAKFKRNIDRFNTCFRPLDKGGQPRQVVTSRVGAQLLARLLALLPRKGHLRRTIFLLDAVLAAEKRRNSPGGETSQLNTLFLVAAEALVRAVVASSERWSQDRSTRAEQLQHATQMLLSTLQRRRLEYSSRIIVSPAERLTSEAEVLDVACEFIKTYGHDLFTQSFLQYGNLLTITHLGPAQYIRLIIEQFRGSPLAQAFEKICEEKFPLEDVAAVLGVITETILGYYTHYIEYNSSTTESDRGENLHILLRHLMMVACLDRILWTHQLHLHVYRTLLRLGQAELAEFVGELFQRSVEPEVETLAFWYQELERLTGVQLATVRRSVTQAANYPLRVEQLRHWARRLAEASTPEESAQAAAAVEALAEEFLAHPQETGFEEPEWIDVIRNEFRRQEKIFSLLESNLQELATLEDVRLDYEDVLRQFTSR